MIINFDASRKIKIWFDEEDKKCPPRVCVPVTVSNGRDTDNIEGAYVCFKYNCEVFITEHDRKLVIDDHLYFFNGNMHVGKISEDDCVTAMNNILAAHIDVWYYVDTAWRIMENNRMHPVEINI